MASSFTIAIIDDLFSGDKFIIQDSYTPTVSIDYLFSVNTTKSLAVTEITQKINNAYNATGRYIVTNNYTNFTITVTDNIGESNFTEVFNNTAGRLNITVNNEAVITPINIEILSISENATNPCNLFDLTVNTNIQADEVLKPINQSVSTNPFTLVGLNRSIDVIELEVLENTNSTTDNTFFYVPFINSSVFKIDIIQDPSSNSVNIVYTGGERSYNENDLYQIQYSLDGVDYSFSKSFSGLPTGNYTAYIKDNIGCEITIPFEITAFEPNVYERKPIFQISEQNSLITKKRELINDIDVFKNNDNTLSFEEETQVNNQSFKQLFQKKDGVITQQFKSSYENTEIKLIDCNGNETIIVQQQKSKNIDITDVRDISLINVTYLNAQFVGVQYVSGKTYDPNTLVENGDYFLGNIVPNFMNIGDFVNIEGAGWRKVKDIIYINQIQTLVVDTLTGNFPIPVNQTVKGTSIYNQLDYEIYEFSFDCNSLSGDYYITYNATDTEFEELNFRTEWFNVSDIQFKTYLLQYYNTENNETNYSTGIVNKIRIPYNKTLTSTVIATQEIYNTDTNTVLVEATNKKGLLLECYPVPSAMIDKISLATSNDRLFLNGMSLIRNEDLESERIGVSNLYRLSVVFIRSDYAFTNIADDGSIVLPTGQPLGVSDTTDGLLFVN